MDGSLSNKVVQRKRFKKITGVNKRYILQEKKVAYTTDGQNSILREEEKGSLQEQKKIQTLQDEKCNKYRRRNEFRFFSA